MVEEGDIEVDFQQLGTETEEGEIVYSKAEIKSQVAVIRGYLSGVAKKKKRLMP